MINTVATSNRADAVLLACLRAGHTRLLKAYAHFLDPYASAVQEEAADTRKLAAEMPKPRSPRKHTFRSLWPPLGVLTTDPDKVLALARATF